MRRFRAKCTLKASNTSPAQALPLAPCQPPTTPLPAAITARRIAKNPPVSPRTEKLAIERNFANARHPKTLPTRHCLTALTTDNMNASATANHLERRPDISRTRIRAAKFSHRAQWSPTSIAA
jgi:hypothetical protein